MSEDVNVKITVDASQANKSTNNFRERVRELKQAMTELQLAGKENSAEYSKLAKELGTIQDAMGDTAAQARNMSDDFLTFKAGLEGIGAAVGSIGAVQGAMALFGHENKAVAETLVKLNGLMTILNSLQTVAKALNKDSALMTALRTKTQKSLNTELQKTSATETAGVKSMTAYTAGEAAATGGAVTLKGAVKAVGTAIKSVPVIGWILAAISAITTLISLISDSNDEEERGNDLLEERKKKVQEINDNYQKNLQTIREENAEISKMLANMGNGSGLLYEESVKAIATYVGVSEEYFKSLNQEEQENLKNTVLWYKETSAEVQKLKQELDEGVYSPGTTAFQEAQQKLWSGQKAIKSYEEKINSEREKGYKWLKGQEAATKAAAEAEKERLKRIEESERDLENLEKFISDETKKFNDETLEGKLANIDAEEIAITNLYDDALDKALEYYGEESEEVRKLNELRLQSLDALNKKRDNTKEKEKKRIEEEKKNAEQEGRDIELAKVKGRLATLRENSVEFYALQQEQLKIETDNELAELQNRYDDGLISFDLYQAEKYRIEQEYLNRMMELNDGFRKNQRAKEIAEAQEKFELLSEMASGFSNLVTTLQDAELANAEGDEKKQAEIKKKYARMNFLTQIAGIGIDTAKGIMSVWSTAGELGPIAGPIVGAIQTAMIAATGIAQTAKAKNEMNTVLRAEEGGKVEGKSHKNGGERVGDSNLEVEGGEYIVNRRATSAFLPLLEAINSYSGNSAPKMTLASNQPTSLTTIDQSVIRNIVRETVRGVSAIPVVVTEHSITRAQRNVKVIETSAIL